MYSPAFLNSLIRTLINSNTCFSYFEHNSSKPSNIICNLPVLKQAISNSFLVNPFRSCRISAKKLKTVDKKLLGIRLKRNDQLELTGKTSFQRKKDIDALMTSGFVTREGNVDKFIHVDFEEYFRTLKIDQNLNNEVIANLLIKEIFVEEKFSKIRSFLNNCIAKHHSNENYAVYGNILRENPRNRKAISKTYIREKLNDISHFISHSLTNTKEIIEKPTVEIIEEDIGQLVNACLIH